MWFFMNISQQYRIFFFFASPHAIACKRQCDKVRRRKSFFADVSVTFAASHVLLRLFGFYDIKIIFLMAYRFQPC